MAEAGRTLNMSERALQTAVVSFLRVALPEYAVFTHAPGEGRRGWKSQRDLKSSGYRKGWPDIEVLYEGRAYFLELKSAKGRVSPDQLATHAAIRRAGCECFIARSLDEVVWALETWAIPLRAKLMPTGAIRVED